MNETRGNTRTKPLNFDNPKTIKDYRQILKYYYGLEENKSGGIKGGEINSLKDTEKTNECIQCTYLTTKRNWSQHTLIQDHRTFINNWFKNNKNIEIINIQTFIIDTYDLCTQIIYKKFPK